MLCEKKDVCKYWHLALRNFLSAIRNPIQNRPEFWVTLRIDWIALRIPIQNRPEFWIVPLHGVPLQMPCKYTRNWI